MWMRRWIALVAIALGFMEPVRGRLREADRRRHRHGHEATTVDVLRPLRLCVPTDVAGTDPGAGEHPDQLLCYRIRGSRFAPTSVSLENELGAGSYALRKRLELCLPAAP